MWRQRRRAGDAMLAGGFGVLDAVEERTAIL